MTMAMFSIGMNSKHIIILKTKPYEVLRPKDEFDVTEYYTAEQIAEKYKVNAKWVWTLSLIHI